MDPSLAQWIWPFPKVVISIQNTVLHKIERKNSKTLCKYSKARISLPLTKFKGHLSKGKSTNRKLSLWLKKVGSFFQLDSLSLRILIRHYVFQKCVGNTICSRSRKESSLDFVFSRYTTQN